MRLFIFIAVAGAFLTGCYQSEPEGYLHTVPTANNSTLIEDSGQGQMPTPTQF